MSDTDLISVVVPVYNLQDCVRQCLESLQAQTYRHFEVLMVDDGSSDGSPEILQAFSRTDPRFRVLSQKNAGVSAARNTGIGAAQGTYLCFVDGDDIVEPDFLKVLHQQITAADNVDLGMCGVDVSGTNTVHGGSQARNGAWTRDQVIEGIFALDSVKGYLVNKIFRRSVIAQYHLELDTASHICEDALFCLEYALHIQTAYFHNAPLYHYIMRPGSATKKGFNTKLLSVVPTLDKIQNITKPLLNKQIDRRVEISKVIMNMFVFRSILKSRQAGFEAELSVTGRNLLPGYRHLLYSGFPLAEKIKYLLVLLYLATHPGTLKEHR